MKKRFPALLLFLTFLPAAGMAAGDGTGASPAAPPARGDFEAGFPFLRNYGPKEYGAAAQNWAIVQDKRGVLYAGNGDGVLEYDGSGWRLIQTEKRTTVRSMAVDDAGRIYVGAQGEIGYLAPDGTGKLHFISLQDRIDPSCRNFSDVWDLHVTPRGVFFNSREFLFLLAGDRIQSWKAATGFHRSFFIHGRLFIRQFEAGLLELVQDRLEMVPGGERFAREKIYVMLPWDSPGSGEKPAPGRRILIGTRTGGFFLFDGTAVIPFPTEADAFIMKNLLYHGALLQDGTVALGTIQGGMIRMDRDGKVLGILDKTAGLADDTVYRILAGGPASLWLAHDKGFTHLEWPAPLSMFDERSGLKGSLLSLHRHQGILYAGTSQGVFRLEPSSIGRAPVTRGYRFRPVNGLNSQNFGFLSLGKMLLVANSYGVFEIRGRDSFLIRPSVVITMSLYRSQSGPARIFVGLQDGLASICRRNPGQASWTDEGKVPGITEEVRNMVEAEDGRLWLGTQAQGVLRVTFSADWRGGAAGPAPRVERFGADQGLPAGPDNFVYAVDGKPAFATTRGIYRYDETARQLVPDPAYARLFPAGHRKVLALQEDLQGRIWLDAKDEIRKIHEAGAVQLQPDGTCHWEKMPFLRFADMTIEAILPEEDGVVWFGGPDGLVRYDPRVPGKYVPAYPALIRLVDQAGGQPLFAGARESGREAAIPELKYEENALRFEFSLPASGQPAGNRYRVRLEGLDRTWSPWSAQTLKEYTTLPEGSYVFRVAARNVYEAESGEGDFPFVILAPWYRTWPAYLGFTLLGLALLAGVIRVYTYRLHREKDRLEQLVARRTLELKEAALTDPLTGLRNRRYMNEILATDVAAFVNFKKYLMEANDRRALAEPSRTIFGIVMFDIDHFKTVNDTYGHEAGDLVLRELARLLKSSVRADDAVMRMGGEEFLVVLKKTVPEYLEAFTGKIMARIRQHEFPLGGDVVLRRTCSIGYTAFPFYEKHPGLITFEQAIMMADLGLYYAKQHGRDRAVRIDAGPGLPAGENIRKMVTSLDFALKHQYFVIKT